MKKLFILNGFVFFLTGQCVAQTVNTLPSSGNVGLGTGTPDTKLQVCGDVKIDSSLTVKEDVEAKNDLKVDGDVFLGGDLYFTNPVPETSTFERLGFLEPNGQLRGGLLSSFIPIFYAEDCVPKTDEFGNIVGYPASVWQSVPGQFYGILHTGTQCPVRVGIGTDSPVSELDVEGKIHAGSTVGIGETPHPFVALSIKEIFDSNNQPTATLIKASSNDAEFTLRNNGETKLNASTTDYAMKIDNANGQARVCILNQVTDLRPLVISG